MGGREGVHGTSACSPLSTCPSFLPVVSRPIHSAIFSANFLDARARERPLRRECQSRLGMKALKEFVSWAGTPPNGLPQYWQEAKSADGVRYYWCAAAATRALPLPRPHSTAPPAPRAQEHAEQGSHLRQTAAAARGVVRGKRSADLSPLLLQLLDARDAAVPYAAQWYVLPAAEGCGSSGAATGRATGRVSIGQQAARRPWPLERGRGCERRASAAADAGGPDAREQGPEAPTARLNLAAACGRRRAGWATACGRAH